MLERRLCLVGGIYEGHQEVSIDVDEYPCETDCNSYRLRIVDGYSIDVVVDDEDEERPSDYDRVD